MDGKWVVMKTGEKLVQVRGGESDVVFYTRELQGGDGRKKKLQDEK